VNGNPFTIQPNLFEGIRGQDEEMIFWADAIASILIDPE
jgi:hypothetical protein